jgi:acyl phosphate:glycerol-3-phosphate acyltransferase
LDPQAAVAVITNIVVLIVAYALGAIPFAYLVTRRVKGLDIRRVGSGNVGATNVLRSAGPALAIGVLLLDAAKGAIAVWLARRAGLSEPFVALAGITAILGHIFPMWLGFRGGKGVATACGVFGLLTPRAWLAAAIALILVTWITRYVSFGAIVGTLVLPVATAATHEPRAVTLAAVAAAAIIVVKHRGNITRLLNGTEPTIGQRLSPRT